MHHLIKLIFIVVVGSMLGSCGATTPAIGTVIPVTPIIQVDDRLLSLDDDLYHLASIGVMIAGTPSEQQSMLGVIPRVWKPSVSTIAVTNTLILGVFTSVRGTNGYEVTIDAVGLDDTVVTVQVIYTTPKPDQLLQPAGPRASFAVVGVDRRLLPAATNLTVRVVDQTNTEIASQTYQMP
ncbi:MAG: hypothetical protein LCH85_17100 [Chloroflexi bacterium]|nr:hypothetical protein [Chloroflexota bacterium]